MSEDRPAIRRISYIIALVLVVVAAIYLIVLLIAGTSLQTLRADSLPLFVITLSAATAALAGWRGERGRTARLEAAELAARERLDEELRREQEKLAAAAAEVSAREQALERERSSARDLERELEIAREAHAGAEDGRRATVEELERTQAAHEATHREHQETMAELGRTEAAHEATRLEHQETRAELERTQAAHEATRLEHQETRAELERRESELSTQLEQQAGEIEALRAQALEHDVVIERTRGELADRDAKLEESEGRRAESEQRAAAAEGQARQERDLRGRIERARRSERDWNRELRGQIFRLHRERGSLGDTDDVRALVLHIAITLLGAEKGLLLQRRDEDVDGGLDLVCAEGFDADPRESKLARRFAREVIAQEATIREDGAAVDDENSDPADREIHNLVAIPIYIQDRFHGAVVCANKPGGFHEFDDEVLLALGDHAGAILENGKLHADLRGAYVMTVSMLAEAIQAKDPFLRGHSDEVSEYVAAVADKLGIDPRRREELLFGSLLHDVGKIGISERILLKPAALSAEERGIIELHPRIGYRLVEQVPALRPIAPAILHHHERWDGQGYPDHLAGEDIPLEARIISVADSFSAMTAERPYRRRVSLEEACDELERCSGTQFDPEVVKIFVEEVRCRPAKPEDLALASALNDPVLQRSRERDEPVLGFSPLAVTDNLTLLYTHRYFHEIAADAAVRSAGGGPPFGIVLAELTDIGSVNQVEGYAAGDEAIRAVARAIQRVAVRCGGTACRYSGRRVALIATEADQPLAEQLAGELADDLADGPRVAIGAASWQEGDRAADLIARARLALSPVPLRASAGP